jgi:ankyrin repeat protein
MVYMNAITNKKVFENAIRQGNLSRVQEYLSKDLESGQLAQLLNTTLPGGELPLHLAIRNNHPKITKLFLEKGADPLKRDLQRMQALDHASFSNNPLHKAHILSKTTSQDLQKVQDQMGMKVLGAETRLKNKINKYKTAPLSFFCPELGKEVYYGNLTNIDEENLNTKDENGLAPIHYAILGNRSEALLELLKKGADYKILGPNNDSLLHIAAMRTIDPRILPFLLQIGLDPNTRNENGETPLHYASIEDNLIGINTLVQAKANPEAKDSQKIAPFAFVGDFVSERDPLNVSFSDFLFPTLALSPFIIPMLTKNAWISPQLASNFATILPSIQNYAPKLFVGYAIFGMFTPSPPKERTGIHASGSLLDLGAVLAQVFLSSYLPPWARTGVALWNQYAILRNVTSGLQTCYQNTGYRNPAKIGAKALIHSISVSNCLQQIPRIIQSYFTDLAVGDFLKSFKAYQTNVKLDPTCETQTCKDLKKKTGESLFEYYKKLEKKPEDIKDATAETDLWSEVKKLKNFNQKELKNLYNTWILSVHPDKHGSEDIFNAGTNIKNCLNLKFKGKSC